MITTFYSIKNLSRREPCAYLFTSGKLRIHFKNLKNCTALVEDDMSNFSGHKRLPSAPSLLRWTYLVLVLMRHVELLE